MVGSIYRFSKPRDKNSLDIGIPPIIIIALIIGFVISFDTVNTVSVSANPMGGIGDIFQTDTFVGNTKWLEKFNFVGMIVQFCITIFGLVSAVVIFAQILLTVMYFAFRPFWDMVSETKGEKTGVLNYSAEIFGNLKGNASKGSDVIMNYLVLLVPNIKKYSEMGSDAADQDWTFTTWLMSTFVNKCILLLVISMTINGSLMQAYLVVVDGMGVVAQRFVDYDSEALVNKVLNSGSNYQFAVGSTGSGFDKLKGEMASSIYKEIIKSTSDQSSDSKMTIGKGIESYVNSVSKEEIFNKIVPKPTGDGTLSEEDWGKVSLEVVVNATGSSENGITVDTATIGLASTGKSKYIHMYFRLRSKSDNTNYWQIRQDD